MLLGVVAWQVLLPDMGGWCCGICTYNPSTFPELICKSKNMYILLTLTKAVTVKVVNPTLRRPWQNELQRKKVRGGNWERDGETAEDKILAGQTDTKKPRGMRTSSWWWRCKRKERESQKEIGMEILLARVKVQQACSLPVCETHKRTWSCWSAGMHGGSLLTSEVPSLLCFRMCLLTSEGTAISVCSHLNKQKP